MIHRVPDPRFIWESAIKLRAWGGGGWEFVFFEFERKFRAKALGCEWEVSGQIFFNPIGVRSQVWIAVDPWWKGIDTFGLRAERMGSIRRWSESQGDVREREALLQRLEGVRRRMLGLGYRGDWKSYRMGSIYASFRRTIRDADDMALEFQRLTAVDLRTLIGNGRRSFGRWDA